MGSGWRRQPSFIKKSWHFFEPGGVFKCFTCFSSFTPHDHQYQVGAVKSHFMDDGTETQRGSHTRRVSEQGPEPRQPCSGQRCHSHVECLLWYCHVAHRMLLTPHCMSSSSQYWTYWRFLLPFYRYRSWGSHRVRILPKVRLSFPSWELLLTCSHFIEKSLALPTIPHSQINRSPSCHRGPCRH